MPVAESGPFFHVVRSVGVFAHAHRTIDPIRMVKVTYLIVSSREYTPTFREIELCYKNRPFGRLTSMEWSEYYFFFVGSKS